MKNYSQANTYNISTKHTEECRTKDNEFVTNSKVKPKLIPFFRIFLLNCRSNFFPEHRSLCQSMSTGWKVNARAIQVKRRFHEKQNYLAKTEINGTVVTRPPWITLTIPCRTFAPSVAIIRVTAGVGAVGDLFRTPEKFAGVLCSLAHVGKKISGAEPDR